MSPCGVVKVPLTFEPSWVSVSPMVALPGGPSATATLQRPAIDGAATSAAAAIVASSRCFNTSSSVTAAVQRRHPSGERGVSLAVHRDHARPEQRGEHDDERECLECHAGS